MLIFVRTRKEVKVNLRHAAQLRKKLKPYSDGICELETKDGEFYAGEIKSISISRKEMKISIKFKWLAKEVSIIDYHNIRRSRWFCQETILSTGFEIIDFTYHSYYHQSKTDRFKIRGCGEVLRFYRKNRLGSITKIDGEIIRISSGTKIQS